jgi:hypothetical protein
MKNTEKSIVTPKWLIIKEMYEKGTNGSAKYGTNFPIDGELDQLCLEFIDMVGTLTQKFGFNSVIEGVKMDLWKERIWSLVENAGLLQDIAWKVDMEDEETEIKDNWYSDEDEFDYEIDNYAQELYEAKK